MPAAVTTTVYAGTGVLPIEYSSESTAPGVRPLSVIVPLQPPQVVGFVDVVVKAALPEEVTK